MTFTNKFEVLPRILITSLEKWEPSIYTEDCSGNFKKEEGKSIPKTKYYSYHIQNFNGHDYLTKSDLTKTSIKRVISGKLVTLITFPAESQLLDVIDGDLVVLNSSSEEIELWSSKVSQSFTKVCSVTINFEEEVYRLNTNQLLIIDKVLRYSVIKVKDGAFTNHSSRLLGAMTLGIINNNEDPEYFLDALVLEPEELVIFITRKLTFFSTRKLDIPIFIAQQRICVPYSDGELKKVNSNLFILNSKVEFVLFQRRENKWILFQKLDHPFLSVRKQKVLIMSPGRQQMIEKAKLIPAEIPLDLKIMIIEFL
jgi:hypothetical protein